MLSPTEWEIVFLSLRVATGAVSGALLVAILMALLLRHPFPGRLLLNTAAHIPLVLPPVVTGYLLLLLFGLESPVGHMLDRVLHIRLVFTTAGAALAAGVTAFPLMLRAISLSLSSIDPRLETAAEILGAGRLRRIASVTLPLALPGIISATIVGFAVAIGAFGAVITFAANIPGETRTIPLAIYSALQVPEGEATAMRLSLVSLLVAIAALALSEWLLARGRGD